MVDIPRFFAKLTRAARRASLVLTWNANIIIYSALHRTRALCLNIAMLAGLVYCERASA